METLKKVGKVILYIIAGIIILLFVAGLFIDPIAKRILVNQVDKAAKGQYSLALDDLDVSILAGTVHMNGVIFETDTTNPAVPPIAFLRANEIAFENVSWLTYLLDKKLVTDRIFFDSLNLELYVRPSTDQQQKQDTAKQKPFRLEQLNIYPAIKKQVDRVLLKDLAFTDINLTMVNVSTKDTLMFDSRELNLKSDNILIDANKLITDERAFFATEIDFLAKDIKIVRSGNKLFLAKINEFNFETLEEMLGISVQKVKFLETGFSQEDTIMAVNMEEFLLKKLNMLKVKKENTAKIEKVSLTDVMVVNNMDTQTNQPADTSAQSLNLAKLSLGENLPTFLESIVLDDLDITKASYRQKDKLRLDKAELHANEIVVNKNSAFAENRFLHAGSLESSFNLLKISMGPDTADVILGGFEFNMKNGEGSLSLNSIVVDPVVEDQSEMWVKAELGALDVSGINTTSLASGELAIDSVGIASPQLLVHLPPSQSKRKAKGSQSNKAGNDTKGSTPASLYPAIEEYLESFYLRKFAVVDAEIKATGLGKGNAVALVPSLYIQLRDILIAEGTAFADERVYHAEDIAVLVENVRYPMPDDINSVKVRMARLSTFEEFFEAEDFMYGVDNITEKKIKKGKLPNTGSFMKVRNELLLVKEINWERLLQKRGFIAGSIISEGLDVYSYTNSNVKTPKNKSASKDTSVTPMPQVMLKQLKMPLYIGKFKMDNAFYTYEELSADSDTAGLARITEISVAAENITNIKKIYTEHPSIPIMINGQLMGSGEFETEVVMNMVADSNLILITGKLDTLDITKLNKFTRYTSILAFESGEIYQVAFDIQADDELAKGELKMSYDNLDIQLSSGSSPDTTGLLKDVGSFLINNLALESDVSPKSSDEPEVAEFSEERKKEKEPFPSYIIQGLISGFLDLMVTIF